jgi:hypothetical protein
MQSPGVGLMGTGVDAMEVKRIDGVIIESFILTGTPTCPVARDERCE